MPVADLDRLLLFFERVRFGQDSVIFCCTHGRSQEFATGGQKRASGGGSPPVGSRGRSLVGVWGEVCFP